MPRRHPSRKTNPTEKEQERTSGLPSRVRWTFNLDAGWGSFGFANSLYNNPKEPGVDDNLSDQWFEGYVKPALSGAYTFASSSELYGKVSVVGERTYGSVPAEFGEDVSSFGPEDLFIGWRSGKSIEPLGENALDFVVGRDAVPPGPRAPVVRWCGRRRYPRWVLVERKEGVRICRDWPIQPWRPHDRIVLPRQGRARRERQR